jgi:hypothetical protein
VTTRTSAARRTDQLLDDINNALGTGPEVRTAMVKLLESDLAGGRTDTRGLRGTSYDGDGRYSRRTEHYVDEHDGARQLTAAEVRAGVVPDWSITVDPDPVGDQVTAAEPDAVHALAMRAVGYARDAANALHALRNTLDAFTQIRDPDPNPRPVAVRYCRCARWREMNRPPVQHGTSSSEGTTVGGRLTEPTKCCNDCYEAVRLTADGDTGEGRLPTEDEIRHHDRVGRWPYAMRRRGAA